MQDYYRYRYEPLDSQYGDNRNADDDDGATPWNDDSANTEDSDDSIMMNAEDHDYGSVAANGANPSGTSPLADAVLAVISQWADDFASNYGLKVSQVVGLLGQWR